MENNEEKLMTETEVMRLLNVNRITLWRYRKNGKIPFYKAGKQCFFKRSEILNSIHSTNKNRESILPEPGRIG